MILRRLGLSDARYFEEIIQVPVQNDVPFASFFEPGMSFEDYLETLSIREDSPTQDSPPTSIFYGFSEGKVIGRLSLRHTLNDRASKSDGHLGIAIHPSFHRQGFASKMIKAAMPHAKELSLNRVLLTADDDNFASQKLIESLGAIYENTYVGPFSEKPVKRYWLSIS